MTQQELIKFIEQEHKIQLDIIKKKNSDYSEVVDPFSNFRMFGEIGFAVRLSDKLSRVKRLLEKGSAEVDESLEDTLRDVANYANLLLAYRKEEQKNIKYQR